MRKSIELISLFQLSMVETLVSYTILTTTQDHLGIYVYYKGKLDARLSLFSFIYFHITDKII